MKTVHSNDSKQMILGKGSAVSLVPFVEAHLESTLSWANDPQLMKLMGRASSLSKSEHEKWFASLAERNDCKFFAVTSIDSSEFIGYVWLWNIDPANQKAELRILIGECKHQSKGLGTEVISLAANYAFENLRLHKVYAYVLSFNPRAKRAFEKAGFVLEGILKDDRVIEDSFTDVFVLGKVSNIGNGRGIEKS